MCRSIPNLVVLRPCDANETKEALKIAYQSNNTPHVIALTRQNLELLSDGQNTKYGAYIIDKEAGPLDLVVMASGSEVKLAIDAKKALGKKGNNIEPQTLIDSNKL